MYPRSFLCEEAKIKQRTPLKKELREIGVEAIWKSQFTSFFYHVKDVLTYSFCFVLFYLFILYISLILFNYFKY